MNITPEAGDPLPLGGNIGQAFPFTWHPEEDTPIANVVSALVAAEAFPIAAYEEPANIEPEFGSIAPRLVASALEVIIDNADVAEMNGTYNLIAAFYEELGLYTFYFINVQPDTNYHALAAGVILREVDKQTDYLTVEALNANGSRFDPSHFGVNLYRI